MARKMVKIVHPTQGESEVHEKAYERVWAAKGWTLKDDGTAEPVESAVETTEDDEDEDVEPKELPPEE